MKWIKASDRLPDNPGRYFIKLKSQHIPSNKESKQVATFTDRKEWYLETHLHLRDPYWVNPYEWLDEADNTDVLVLKEVLKRAHKEGDILFEKYTRAMNDATAANERADSISRCYDTFKAAAISMIERYSELFEPEKSKP